MSGGRSKQIENSQEFERRAEDHLRNSEKDGRSLNARQIKMAELMVTGMATCDAYRSAGYKGSPAKNAYQIAGNHGFQEYLEELRAKSISKAIATREEIMEVGTSILRGETDGDRLKAGDMLNKMLGNYAPEKIDANVAGEFTLADVLARAQEGYDD